MSYISNSKEPLHLYFLVNWQNRCAIMLVNSYWEMKKVSSNNFLCDSLNVFFTYLVKFSPFDFDNKVGHKHTNTKCYRYIASRLFRNFPSK